jgi:hypothetical protein
MKTKTKLTNHTHRPRSKPKMTTPKTTNGMKTMHYPERFTFRLDAGLVKELETLALENDRSINSMGRKILRDGIARLRRQRERSANDHV